MTIKIKPLSVNKCWQGRRFKTKEYKRYEQEVLLMLTKHNIPNGALKIFYEVGYSNKLSDIDNFIKPFQDILQKRYNFNDSRIYQLVIDKKIVKKGEEYIKFEINEAYT